MTSRIPAHQVCSCWCTEMVRFQQQYRAVACSLRASMPRLPSLPCPSPAPLQPDQVDACAGGRGALIRGLWHGAPHASRLPPGGCGRVAG